MTDKKIEEIKERLGLITPTPWIYDERVGCLAVYAGEKQNCLAGISNSCIYYASGYKDDGKWHLYERDINDGKFIANAPEDISYLLEKIEQLKETLEFYADPDSYIISTGTIYGNDTQVDHGLLITQDSGKRARKELNKNEGINDD